MIFFIPSTSLGHSSHPQLKVYVFMHSVFSDLLLADFPSNLNRQLDRTGSRQWGESYGRGLSPHSFNFTHSDLIHIYSQKAIENR